MTRYRYTPSSYKVRTCTRSRAPHPRPPTCLCSDYHTLSHSASAARDSREVVPGEARLVLQHKHDICLNVKVTSCCSYYTRYSLSLSLSSDFVPGKVGTWQISHSQTRNNFSYINQQDSGGTRKPSLYEGMPASRLTLTPIAVSRSADFTTLLLASYLMCSIQPVHRLQAQS